MTVLLCPLCSQPRFNNLESLRLSLVNAATQSISCPICDDILMGLDKLTIHLFGHTLNQGLQNSQSLELKLAEAKEEVQEQSETSSSGKESQIELGTLNNSETFQDDAKFTGEIPNSYDGDKLYQEEPKTDNLCTVNMEDLSFLTSWDIKPKQDQKEHDVVPCMNEDEKHDSSDLSEYMSDLLNKKLPILNFAFTMDTVERDKTTEKEEETENKLKCRMCGFYFQNQIVLSMHEELVHSKEKNAEQVQQEFMAEMTVDDKSNLVDISTMQQESNCEVQLSDVACGSDVRLDETLPRYDCHLCSKSFKMRGSLLVHFRVAHFGLQSPESLQVLGDASSPEERNHPCPICSKSFKKEQHLSQHIKTHEGKQWQCETCSKYFTTKYFLKKHQRLHTGEMPYSCQTCKKTFTFQQSYHKHLLYHSDEKPHQCNQCGRSFKELSTLHNHQRIHSGEKPFACEICGKCFRQRVSYIVHQRIHTGVLPYQCTACKKKFRYKVSQRSHKCTSQPPGIVIRQQDLVQKILEHKHILQQNQV